MDFTEWLDRTWRLTTRRDYPAAFLACARTFAQRFFAAFAIFALPAADRTRFFTPVSSRFVESPKAFAAARTPLNWCCILCHCFSSFLSSRLIAARMSMNPPDEIYLNRTQRTVRVAGGKLFEKVRRIEEGSPPSWLFKDCEGHCRAATLGCPSYL